MTNGLLYLRGALIVIILAFANATASESQLRGEVFSNICYRRKPVVSYIKRTKAWREGRRDVLDYGCGSGALSEALAKEGATRVVAIDLKPNSVNAAKQRLAPFPNANARGPRLAAKAIGVDGLIAFTNQFDLVISYMGALADGTSDKQKIAASLAMDRAVRACRDGGSVIVAECSGLGGLLSLPTLAAAVTVLVTSPRLLEKTKRLYFLVIGMIVSVFITGGLVGGYGLLLPFAARSIARSITAKRMTIVSSLWVFLSVYVFCSNFMRDRKIMSERTVQMEKAGLRDVRTTRKPSFRIIEIVKDNPFARFCALIFFCCYYPGSVIIYEGIKTSIKSEEED